jgi:hypothetical protein
MKIVSMLQQYLTPQVCLFISAGCILLFGATCYYAYGKYREAQMRIDVLEQTTTTTNNNLREALRRQAARIVALEELNNGLSSATTAPQPTQETPLPAPVPESNPAPGV